MSKITGWEKRSFGWVNTSSRLAIKVEPVMQFHNMTYFVTSINNKPLTRGFMTKYAATKAAYRWMKEHQDGMP